MTGSSRFGDSRCTEVTRPSGAKRGLSPPYLSEGDDGVVGPASQGRVVKDMAWKCRWGLLVMMRASTRHSLKEGDEVALLG